MIYHYTTLDALINGIIIDGSKTGKEICLWATKSEYLNDLSEKKLGIKEGLNAIKRFEKKFGRKPFGASIDSNDVYNHFIRTYIVSFTENKDELPMWSLYGEKGAGVVLGFDEDCINIQPKSCTYYYNYRIIDGFLIDIDAQSGNGDYSQYFKFFLGLIVGLKDSKYEYEKEVRCAFVDKLTINDNNNEIRPLREFENEETFWRVRNGNVIPYKKMYLSKACLKKIILGPKHSDNFQLQKEALACFLYNKLGDNNIEILSSKIKFR